MQKRMPAAQPEAELPRWQKPAGGARIDAASQCDRQAHLQLLAQRGEGGLRALHSSLVAASVALHVLQLPGEVLRLARSPPQLCLQRLLRLLPAQVLLSQPDVAVEGLVCCCLQHAMVPAWSTAPQNEDHACRRLTVASAASARSSSCFRSWSCCGGARKLLLCEGPLPCSCIFLC